MADRVEFYRPGDAHGYMSNFARYPIATEVPPYGTVMFRTSEHYFQAMKFTDPEHFWAVVNAPTPSQAAAEGRSRRRPLRGDWESVKDDVMRVALRLKFEQHRALREKLLATGAGVLVEHSPVDYYWGDGARRTGRNMLGVLLMELRDKLRAEDREKA